MGLERPLLSRDTLMATGLLSVVVACGFGGMLLAKHYHHPSTTVEAASSAFAGTEDGTDVGPGRSYSPGVPLPLPVSSARPAAPRQTQGQTKPDPDEPITTSPARVPVEQASGFSPAGVTGSGTANVAVGATEATAANPVAGVHSPGYITEDQEINLVLGRWRRALLSNDAAEVAPSYASKIERYFLQSNVNRAYVREYMETEEETGSRLASYNLKDVSIDHVSADEVDVRFVADFRVISPWREREGGARTLLKLRREDGDWKIFYERDFNS